MKFPRRSFLGMATAAAVLPPWARAADTWTPLGAVAAKKGARFGFALNAHWLKDNAAYRDLVVRECTIVVPENAMKWEATQPARDRFDFEQADLIANFANQHHMQLRGHCLVWHRALPPWVEREANKDTAETILREHITTCVKRYKGLISSWDVVNEAIQPRDNQPGDLRNSLWYQLLGPRYIDIAFEAAHAADPKAVLAYNDYGLEYENRSDTPKRQTVLKMIAEMKKRGTPIHALGMQAHLRAGTHERLGEDLPAFVKELHGMGIQVYITELDCDDKDVRGTDDEKRQAVADMYKRFLDVMLGTGAVPTVITWGAWNVPHVAGAVATSGPKAVFPLLFDTDGEPEPAAEAVVAAFHAAPQQGA